MGPDEETVGRLRAVVWRLLFLPQVVGSAVWTFLKNWFLTRSGLALLLGLPALAAAVGVGSIFEVVRSVSNVELVVRYQRSAAGAEQAGDPEAVRLWREKVIQLDPEASQPQYQLALTDAQQGRLEQARAVMRQIAPRDSQGDPDAHFWLARDMLAGKPALTAELAAALQHHLTASLRSEQAAGEAHVLLGELNLEQKELDQAIVHFAAATEQRPELGVLVGQLHLRQGDATQAKLQLEKTSRHFRQRSELRSGDLEARLAWAHCELLLGNLAESERILEIGRRSSDDPRFARGLSAVRLAEFDRVRQEEPANLERAVRLLEQAAALAPDDPQVIDRLVPFSQADAPARREARRVLERIVDDGEPTAATYMLLGVIATKDGDLGTARTHFEEGLKLRPDTPVLMNNLAWVLANADPPELDRALELAENACQKPPARAEYLETRGQIFAKLSRWKECIADLEHVLRLMPGRVRVHQTLAAAYVQLGQREMAAEHRRIVDELKAAQEKSP